MARPQYKPTTAQRRSVSIAIAAGTSQDDVAAALGISRTTLIKHFKEELTVSATRRRMQVLESMFIAARKGNVAAMKAFLAMSPVEPALPAPHPAFAEPKPEQPVGLKEKRDAEARVAAVGTDWEALLPGSVPLQ